MLLWLCMGLGWDLLLCSGGAAVTQPWSCFANTTSKAAAKGSEEGYSQEWGSQALFLLLERALLSAWACSTVPLVAGEQWSSAAAFKQHSLNSARGSNTPRVCGAVNPPASPARPLPGAAPHSSHRVHLARRAQLCALLAPGPGAQCQEARGWERELSPTVCALPLGTGPSSPPIASICTERSKIL